MKIFDARRPRSTRRRSLRPWSLACIALALVVSACSSGDDQSGDKSADPITIAVMAPFSGDYAIFGEGYKAGIETWIAVNGEPEVNGRPVEFVYPDEGCDVSTGQEAFRRVSNKITAVMGPSCSAVVKALKPAFAQAKTPVLFLGHSSSITEDETDGWVFRLSQPDRAIVGVFADYLFEQWKSEGVSKVALMHDTSTTNADAPQYYAGSAKDAGIDLVENLSYELGTTDFTPQLLKVRQSGAEALILQSFGGDEAKIIKQAASMGLKLKLASGSDTPYPETIEGGMPEIDGVVFYADYVAGADDPGIKKFEDAWNAENPDVLPVDLNYEAYLGMSLMMEALKQPGADAGGEALRDAIANINYKFGDIDISFLPNGDQANLLTFIGKVEDGKAKLVKLAVSPRAEAAGYAK